MLDGRDLRHDSARPAGPALGMGRTFQRMELFGGMTVRENIELAAECALTSRRARCPSWGSPAEARRAGRKRHRSRTSSSSAPGSPRWPTAWQRQTSTGQGRLVELARAMAREPQVLLLDEPSSGLDHAESEVFGQLWWVSSRSATSRILMVEHDMSLVLGICDWIHVLDFGKPLMDGSPAEVRTSEAVRRAYLGEAA